ncbi:MAG: hypothetical protein HOJ35_01895 [Bdellovibrionales bacterium]|jgi:hypothetical protein|nr:hypothetical protein [Bdellovibrionales bacterium]
MQRYLLILLTFFSISILGSEIDIKYYSGYSQFSSIDGAEIYGPKEFKIIKREVHLDLSKIIETIYKSNGTSIITNFSRINDSFSYNVSDLDESFNGIIEFESSELNSWSYNLDIIKPEVGKITGARPDYGAIIDDDGTINILKIWNDSVLVSEEYKEITLNNFLTELGKY